MADSSFDFTNTNLIMTIGGHLLLLSMILIVVLTDIPMIQFPTKNIKNMLNSPMKLAK